MKRIKKLFWIFFAIFVSAIILISMYGMGRDVVGVIPQWLTEFIVGFCAFILLVILAIIFICGIIKIKEIGSNDQTNS